MYAVIEYWRLKNENVSIFPAKALGIYLMPLSIVVFFYTYRAFLEESLVIDIMIFVLAVIIGQIVSYRIMVWKEPPKIFTPISIFALLILALIFIAFTFYTPHLPIFQDPITGIYGIKG
ncbi:MAG: hypothetical protein H5T34_04660 [Candidatus Methanomethyliales bacterium]|nr:hypothetical protein [Candidatus Methanomethylicales archaeon]